jgi:hypothetical protein
MAMTGWCTVSNHVTQAERQALIAKAAGMLETQSRGTVAQRLQDEQGVSYDRAWHAIAKVELGQNRDLVRMDRIPGQG